MGENSWTVYHIGGKLPQAKLAEFKELIDGYEESDEPKHGEVFVCQGICKDGDDEDLDQFCIDNGLTFHAAWAAVPGAFDSGARWWNPEMGEYPDEATANDNGEPNISLGDLEAAQKKGDTLADIIAELRPQSSLNVPPLEIIEEPQPQAA